MGILAVKWQTMAFGGGGDPEIVFGGGFAFDGESLLQFGIRGGRSVIGQEKYHLAGEALPLLDGCCQRVGCQSAFLQAP